MLASVRPTSVHRVLARAVSVQKGVRNMTASTRASNPGYLYVWGSNSNGQIGDGTTNASSTPIRVSDELVSDFSIGHRHCLAVLASNGQVFGWGDNTYGQLGNSSVSKFLQLVPVEVEIPNNTPIKTVSSGAFHSLFLADNGTVFSSGWCGSFFAGCGGVGVGSSKGCVRTPEPVKGLPSNIVGIAAGGYHSLALSSDGEVFAWGRGDWGRLGTGTHSDKTSAVLVDFFKNDVDSKVVEVFACRHHSGALTEDGRLYTWGKNSSMQLGHPLEENKVGGQSFDAESLPRTVDGFKGAVTHAALGTNIGCAVTKISDTDAQLWSWGNRQVYTPRTATLPKGIQHTDIRFLGAGEDFFVAVDSQSHMYHWGKRAWDLKFRSRSGDPVDVSSVCGVLPGTVQKLDVGDGVIGILAAE